MKIEITKHQELVDIGKTVKPGDVLESSDTIPAELLQAYVRNGIAKNLTPPSLPLSGEGLLSPGGVDSDLSEAESQNNEGGE